MGIFQYGVLGVDLFFVISGVVISAVTIGKFSNARNAGTFLYHRFARIYPTYWVYSAIVLAAFLYNPLWINAGSGHHVDILPSFLLIPTHVSMLVMQGWTLSYEIYFYLIFFLLLLVVPERIAPAFLAFWGASIIVIALRFPVPAAPILNLITNPAILEFLAGCLIYHLYRQGALHPRAGLVLIALAFVWFAAIAAWTSYAHHSNQDWVEQSRWLRPALYGSFSSILLLGLMEVERTNLIRFGRPLALVGDWSYSIYLSHIILIELVGRIMRRFAAHLPLAMLIVDAVALPLVLLVGYLSYTLLERPLITVLYKKPAKSLVPATP
jgi:peptidoglycan/LPS O-acetylase OafA/YrhL